MANRVSLCDTVSAGARSHSMIPLKGNYNSVACKHITKTLCDGCDDQVSYIVQAQKISQEINFDNIGFHNSNKKVKEMNK